MGYQERCPVCYPHEQMFRAYIRKYDYNRKAKWIAKGWICENCDTFFFDGELKK